MPGGGGGIKPGGGGGKLILLMVMRKELVADVSQMFGAITVVHGPDICPLHLGAKDSMEDSYSGVVTVSMDLH